LRVAAAHTNGAESRSLVKTRAAEGKTNDGAVEPHRTASWKPFFRHILGNWLVVEAW